MSEKAEPSQTKGACAALHASLRSTLRSASGIFVDVHAAAENDRTLFRGCGRETLRGFFYFAEGAYLCRARRRRRRLRTKFSVSLK